MVEIWKSIDGYEGLYEVSSFGRVRSVDRVVEQVRNDGRVIPHAYKGRVLTPRRNKLHGYLEVNLCKRGHHYKTCRVHRLVATAFLENPNSYSDVNHIDEDKNNNSVSNLEWCDRYYNTHYGTRNDRLRTIFRKRNAKISTEDVAKIKLLRDNGTCVREIERMFGISNSQVYRILNNENWRE